MKDFMEYFYGSSSYGKSEDFVEFRMIDCYFYILHENNHKYFNIDFKKIMTKKNAQGKTIRINLSKR